MDTDLYADVLDKNDNNFIINLENYWFISSTNKEISRNFNKPDLEEPACI